MGRQKKKSSKNHKYAVGDRIEDVIYMGFKNDISFLVDNYMNLYETQSTRNPNMPLRGLIYFGQVYEGYAQQYGLNIYAEKQVKIPTPRYIVLYNGTKDEPERREYLLSDAFIQEQEEHCLECIATVLNINAGHNKELMENCRTLYEYAEFVSKIRAHLGRVKTHVEELEAVDTAIEECIKEGILVEFLSKHRGEVRKMLLTEFDEEKYIRSEKLESYDQGRLEGRTEGEIYTLIRLVIVKMRKNLSCSEVAELLEVDPDIIQPLYDVIEANPGADAETICQLLLGASDKIG